MQWSPRASAAAGCAKGGTTYQYEPRDAGDRETSCWGGNAPDNSTGGAFSASGQPAACVKSTSTHLPRSAARGTRRARRDSRRQGVEPIFAHERPVPLW